MKKVLVLISDENYLEHAKSLFYSARSIGKWDGDLCLIANNIKSEKLEDLNNFGVEFLKISEPNYYYANYHIFDVFFKKWDFLISMDCDFTIFGDLNKIINEEDYSKDQLNVDKEPFTIKSYFCWSVDNGQVVNERCEGREHYFDELKKLCNIDDYGFNAGFMSFNTSLIQDNTLFNLYELSKKYQEINFHTSENGSDQPILNIYFYDKVKFIENKKVSYWRHSDENTITQHHCRWDAPWVNNFYCQRLQSTYHNQYINNLKKFYAGTH